MNRRTALTGCGTIIASLSGCVGSDGGNGEESGPEYEEGDRDGMVLTIDAFPDGWTRDDDFNENFDASYLSEDESVVVLARVEIEDSVDAAKESFESSESGTRDPQDYDIGDEAFWDTRNDEYAATVFRHSNAVGQVAALRESGTEVVPDQSRSQEYAQKMFEQW